MVDNIAAMNQQLGLSPGLIQALGREYGGTKKSFFDFHTMVQGGLAKQINQYNQMKGTVQATTQAIETMAHPLKAVSNAIEGTRYGKMAKEIGDYNEQVKFIINTSEDQIEAQEEVGKLTDAYAESMGQQKAEMTGSIMGMVQYNMAQKKMGLEGHISLMDVLGAKWAKFKNLVIFVMFPIIALAGFIALLALAFQDGTGPMADFMDEIAPLKAIVESMKDVLQALGFDVSENAGTSEDAALEFNKWTIAGDLLVGTLITLGLAMMGVAWPIAIMVGLLILGLALFNQLEDAGYSFGEAAGIVGGLIGGALIVIGIAFGGVLGSMLVLVGFILILVGLFFYLKDLGLSTSEAVAVVALVGIPLFLALLYIMFGLAGTTLLWIGILLIVIVVAFLIYKIFTSKLSLGAKIALSLFVVLVGVLFVLFLGFLKAVIISSLAAGTIWPILLIAAAFIAVVILLVLFFKFRTKILAGFVALGKGIVNVFIWVGKMLLKAMTWPWRMIMKGLSHIPGLGFLGNIAEGLGDMIDDIPMLELGGFMDAGSLAIVGESGPEFFMPDMAGTVIPSNGMDFASMGGGLGGGGMGDKVIEENRAYQKTHLNMLKAMGSDFRTMRKDVANKLIGGPVKITNNIYTIDLRRVTKMVSASMSDSLNKLGVGARGD